MSARPKLHEVGSLLKKEGRTAVSSASKLHEIRETESFNLTPIAVLERESPPMEVLDESIDSAVDGEVPENIFFSSTEIILPNSVSQKHSDLDFVAELTEADKIEAVCEKIHPEVRRFIEEELRARFVAVRG